MRKAIRRSRNVLSWPQSSECESFWCPTPYMYICLINNFRELKAVNVWYQNKRRSAKKQSMVWKPEPSPSQASSMTSLSRSNSVSLIDRRSISLDSIAEARQRPTPNTPPKRVRRTTIPVERPSDSQELWQLMQSSPNAPPSSPGIDSLLMSSLPATSKTKRSLEWACAQARAGRKKRKRRHGAHDIRDVPPLRSLHLEAVKESEDASMSDTEVEELVTPNSSMDLPQLRTPVRLPVRRLQEDWDFDEDDDVESRKENVGVDECDGAAPSKKKKDVEAAITLLDFKVRS